MTALIITRAIYYGVLLLGIALGIKNFKSLALPFKWLLVLLVVTLITEVIALGLALTIRTSGPVYHINTVLFFGLVNGIYYHLSENKILKLFTIYSIPVFVLLAVLNVLFLESFFRFPVFTSVIEGLKNVFLALFFFVVLLKDTEETDILKNKRFWLNCAILFFNVTTLCSFALRNYLLTISVSQELISDIVYWSAIVYYLVLAYTLIEKEDKPKQ